MEAQSIFSGFNLPVYKIRTRIRSRPDPILHLHYPTSSILNPPVSHLRRYITSCSAHSHHDHGHHQPQHNEHRHDHNHHHHHHHGSGECNEQLTKPQEILLNFADMIRWTHLANFLREHLELCCCSAALFIAAAACPYVIPKPAVKPLQHAFAVIAFPLVGISASLDSLVDIAGGKINIHVLMALAAFASVFMGNPLEGGLLLAMFNLSHIAEEYFTSRSKVDVNELKENHPEFALLLDVNNGSLPSFSDLTYHEVPVSNLKVGSFILVKAGESVPVDCEVLKGSSTITVEHLTGELKPLEKNVGDSIPGGARNLDGMLIVKAKKTWKESTLSRIVQLTEEAQLSKPKLQRWLDKFGEQYSKVVVLLSISVAVIGPFLFRWPFISTSERRRKK